MLSKDSPLPCQPFCLISYMIPFLFSGFKLLLLLTSLLPQNLSTSQRPLCVVGRLGRSKKESTRGTTGGRRRGREASLPSSHRPPRAYYFSLLLFSVGHPAGACAVERESGYHSSLISFIEKLIHAYPLNAYPLLRSS